MRAPVLKHLSLKFFRKHENLQLDFEPGLVAIRAANECGKSTLVQAIAYALFGARALPQPIEEVVTYGHPAAALHVSLEAEIRGELVRIERSSRGAQLHSGDRLVTGQTETANYISNLVGAPANLANSLWFANQGQIRGALGAGSKAASTLIEQLADFAQIDRIIELIQSNLPTGPTKPYEERLAQAQETLDSIGEPSPPADRDEELQRLEQAAKACAERAEAAKQAVVEHEGKFAPVAAAWADKEKLQEQMRWSADQKSLLQDKLLMLRLPSYDAAAHEKAKQEMYEVAQVEQRQAQYERARRAFLALPVVKSVWEGDGPSFISFVEELEQQMSTVTQSLSGCQMELGGLNRQVLEGQCAVCGLAYETMDAVVTLNERVEQKRTGLHKLIEVLDTQLKKCTAERTAVRLIQQQWQVYRDFLARYSDYVSVDNQFVPPKVHWQAEIATPNRADEVREALAKYERSREALLKVQATQASLQEQIEHIVQQSEGVLTRLAKLSEQSQGYDEMLASASRLRETAQTAQEHAQQAHQTLANERAAYEQALVLYQAQMRSWELAKAAQLQASQQLAEVTANNVLLKKVRSARPAIVDRLWTVLLAALSHYFTQMRQTKSVVSRNEGAFLVDGQPIEGLSGSTLDILGLAVRVALLKTFLPICSFLVLDEPGAACDEEREAALLGTVVSAQFAQVVVITHSDVADAFANQLVTL
jgi:DNA repair exonuclease SbcCD ATPase subunit